MKQTLFLALMLAIAIAVITYEALPKHVHLPQSLHGIPLAPNIRCDDARCTAYQVFPYVRTRSKYGIGCMGNTPPGTLPNPEPPPQSYAVADIGKPGFPALSADERETVRRIRQYVSSATLRIAWLAKSRPSDTKF